MADQLSLSQPGGRLCPPHITTRPPPRFSVLPPSLHHLSSYGEQRFSKNRSKKKTIFFKFLWPSHNILTVFASMVFLNNYCFFSSAVLLVLRARMFKTSDLNIVKKILTYCYLGDWWVLYQLGRNSNTHFFRYLLRHIEHDFVLKEKRALREERRRHRRPPGKVGPQWGEIISKGSLMAFVY